MAWYIFEFSARVNHPKRFALLIGITVVHGGILGCSSSESGTSVTGEHIVADNVLRSSSNTAPWTISFAPDPHDLANCGMWESLSTVTETNPDYIVQARAAVERGLGKYSNELRQSLDLRVLCVATIAINGKRVSGTNSRDSGVVLLSIRNKEDKIDSERIEQVLHSEVSTILVWKNLDKFPGELWTNANPEGFRYSGQDPLDFAGEQPVATVDELRNGFLGKYAQISPTQDINRVAEQLMMENPRYAAAIRAYPRLRLKASAYAIFLARIDPPLGQKAMAFVRAATEE